MADPCLPPWLTIIGIGEDGLDGLSSACRAALEAAALIFGGRRHLDLAGAGGRGREWPVPFSIAPVLEARGQAVVVLASGDPFWFGAGTVLAAALAPQEWRAFPAPSTFALAASRLGWRLEETVCAGLHAAPFESLIPDLSEGRQLLCLLRDGEAPAALARWLDGQGFGGSQLHVLERLGGPHERIRQARAETFDLGSVAAPVAVAIVVQGRGLPRTPGLPDDAFRHDGQITRQAVRALTLAALAPRHGERLWDIGAGSGSVSVEWCLAAGGSAIAIEPRSERLSNIEANAARFGLSRRIAIVQGAAPAALTGLPQPDAVFVGGGADDAVIEAVWAVLPAGARLVVNSVTLETEALLMARAARHGGTLLRFDMATAAPLGRKRGWEHARPIVQWSVTR